MKQTIQVVQARAEDVEIGDVVLHRTMGGDHWSKVTDIISDSPANGGHIRFVTDNPRDSFRFGSPYDAVTCQLTRNDGQPPWRRWDHPQVEDR